MKNSFYDDMRLHHIEFALRRQSAPKLIVAQTSAACAGVARLLVLVPFPLNR